MFRAIDINALIGTIGGYIGLFLGYSILQFPDFVFQVITRYSNNKTKIQKTQERLNSASAEQSKRIQRVPNKTRTKNTLQRPKYIKRNHAEQRKYRIKTQRSKQIHPIRKPRVTEQPNNAPAQKLHVHWPNI